MYGYLLHCNRGHNAIKEGGEGGVSHIPALFSQSSMCLGEVRGWGGRLGSLMPGKMREESLRRRVGPGGSESSGGSLSWIWPYYCNFRSCALRTILWKPLSLSVQSYQMIWLWQRCTLYKHSVCFGYGAFWIQDILCQAIETICLWYDN